VRTKRAALVTRKVKGEKLMKGSEGLKVSNSLGDKKLEIEVEEEKRRSLERERGS